MTWAVPDAECPANAADELAIHHSYPSSLFDGDVDVDVGVAIHGSNSPSTSMWI